MTTVLRLVAAAAAAVALAGAAGCSAGAAVGEPAGPRRAAPAAPAGTLPPVEPENGVVHVHGLGVDPADGVLYAATHTGVFRIPEQGRAERVANRAQDTMGFSVTGPGRFIGSGHPDPREDDVRPPLLGLVESDDAGRTWQRVSLHGEADFHALAAAHGLVYGYDSTSGTFMVTTGRQQWDRRSRLPLRDFAVDPADPDGIVATTEQGPVASSDGGRTWAPLDGAPALVVLAWTARGVLVGVAVDGTVHRSGDSGRTWTPAGSAGGPPEGVAVDARRGVAALYVAVAGQGIVVSGDGGRTFAVRYAE